MPGAFTQSPIRWCEDLESDVIASVQIGFARPDEPAAERGVRFTLHAGSAAAKRLLAKALRADPGLRLDFVERVMSRAQLHALARWHAQWAAS